MAFAGGRWTTGSGYGVRADADRIISEANTMTAVLTDKSVPAPRRRVHFARLVRHSQSAALLIALLVFASVFPQVRNVVIPDSAGFGSLGAVVFGLLLLMFASIASAAWVAVLTGSKKVAGIVARSVGFGDRKGLFSNPAFELVDFCVRGRPTVNLAVFHGEIIGIAGLPGSGRTSLFRAILGDIASSGTLRIDGEDVGRVTPHCVDRLGVAVIPQHRKLVDPVVQGSIAASMDLMPLGTYLGYWGFARRDLAHAVIEDTIGRVEKLSNDPARRVAHTGSDNARKMSRMSARSKVLLLDLPNADVDIGTKRETSRRVRELAAGGAAILLISDDLDELLSLSDRIAVMTQGVMGPAVDVASFNHSTLLAAISRTGTSLSQTEGCAGRTRCS